MTKPTKEDLDLAAATERQLGLPSGALVGFVAEGGQIDGRARAKVLDKHGVDAKMNARNRIEATGLALQDAMSSNKGDSSLALAELHSGVNRAKWNKSTTQFASRALGTRAADGTYMGDRPTPPTMPAVASSPTGQRSASGVTMTRPTGNRSASGLTDPRASMAPVPVTDYGTKQSVEPEAMTQSVPAAPVVPAAPSPMATMASPTAGPVASPAAAGEPEGPTPVGPKSLAAYADGTMPVEQRRILEQVVADGGMTVPDGFSLQATPEPSTFDRVTGAVGRAGAAVSEMVTGDKRRTAETESKPDFYGMPEFNESTPENIRRKGTLSGQIRGAASALTGGIVAGSTPETMRRNAMFAAPAEIVQIMQANYPGTEARQDDRGNWFVTSTIDGKEYAIKPGIQVSDIPRIVGGAAVGAASTASGGIVPIVGTAMAGQAGIEAYQAASGGDFNKLDIGLAGAASLAAPILGAVARGGKGIANAALEGMPGFGSAVANTAVDVAAPAADDVARAAAGAIDDVTKVVPAPVGVVDDVTKVVPPPVGTAPVAPVVDNVVEPISEAAAKEVGPEIADLIRAASGKGAKAKVAQAELAKAFEVSPAALAAAERLGVVDNLPVDVLANNVQLKNTVGSMRAKVGTKAEADFAKSMGDTVGKIDEVLKDLGAEASPAGFSDRVLERFREVQEGLKAAAKTAYEDVNKAVKPSDNVTLDNIALVVASRKKDMGGALEGIDAVMASIVSRAKVVPGAKTNEGVLRATFGVIKSEKAQIRKALERMESAYGSADENVLKEYNRALVADEIANVGRIGGADLAEKASLANRLWAQKKEIDEKITGAFGKQESGDISRLLLSAVTDAGKGSVAKLNKLLEVLPPEMHGEAMMTAIGSLTRAKGGASASAESFGAAEFAALFRGLRAKGNERIYGQIEKSIGPKRAGVLRDVYEISRRITDARSVIRGTGKDAQDVLANLGAENMVGALLGSPIGKQAARGIGAVVGAGVGGLPGAAVGGAVVDSIITRIAIGGEEQVIKAGAVMMSAEFKALAVDGLVKNPIPKKDAVRALISTKVFRDWAKAASLSREPKALEQWVMAAIQGARTPTKDAVVREDR